MSDERQARILSATRALLLHYGYDKMTVSDIAREAGVSKGAIYLHFESKEKIIHALVTEAIHSYSVAIMRRLEADAEQWSFIRLYQIAFEILADDDLLKAVTRNDRRIFGSYLQKEGLEWIQYKRQSRYPLLKAMQDAGALRAEVDMRAVDYIMSLIVQGLAFGDAVIGDEQQIPTEVFINAFGQMLESWLVPADGGNREAGKQIMLAVFRAFNEQIEAKEQGVNEDEHE